MQVPAVAAVQPPQKADSEVSAAMQVPAVGAVQPPQKADAEVSAAEYKCRRRLCEMVAA